MCWINHIITIQYKKTPDSSCGMKHAMKLLKLHPLAFFIFYVIPNKIGMIPIPCFHENLLAIFGKHQRLSILETPKHYTLLNFIIPSPRTLVPMFFHQPNIAIPLFNILIHHHLPNKTELSFQIFQIRPPTNGCLRQPCKDPKFSVARSKATIPAVFTPVAVTTVTNQWKAPFKHTSQKISSSPCETHLYQKILQSSTPYNHGYADRSQILKQQTKNTQNLNVSPLALQVLPSTF